MDIARAEDNITGSYLHGTPADMVAAQARLALMKNQRKELEEKYENAFSLICSEYGVAKRELGAAWNRWYELNPGRGC